MAENGNSTAVVRRYADTTPATAPFGGDAESFGTAQRIAQALTTSTIMPANYRGNLANVLVAMEYAQRLGCSVLAVAQNLDVIDGRPALRSTFLIGTVNASRRFTPLRFRWQGTEGTDAWGCRAVAKDRETGEECIGSLITVGLAKKKGWWGRKGSSWPDLTEQMCMYRAAAFWTRVYAPELSLGLYTSDEAEDVYGGIEVPSRVHNVVAALDSPDAPEESPADLLRRLRQEARDADVLDSDGERSIEVALASEDEEEIQVWIDSVRSELARLDGAQPGLGV